jgi:hypothetical protein
MNSHQIWLRQLQDQVDKRKSDGKFTTTEMNQKQFEIRNSTKEQPEQLDELPILAPLAGMAVRGVASKALGGLAKKAAGGIGKAVKGIAANAMAGSGGGGGGCQCESVKEQLECERIMEEIAYEMIEEFEQTLGRRLLPEEIEEFVDNRYQQISEKANQVTANAHPGDKNTGVGATKPVEQMKSEGGSLKAKAAKFNPKSVGSEGY